LRKKGGGYLTFLLKKLYYYYKHGQEAIVDRRPCYHGLNCPKYTFVYFTRKVAENKRTIPIREMGDKEAQGARAAFSLIEILGGF
jgi:hypothetical protein